MSFTKCIFSCLAVEAGLFLENTEVVRKEVTFVQGSTMGSIAGREMSPWPGTTLHVCLLKSNPKVTQDSNEES